MPGRAFATTYPCAVTDTQVVPAADEPDDERDLMEDLRTDDGEQPARRRRWHVLLVFPAVLVVAAGVLLTLNLMGLGQLWFERAVIDGPAKKNFVLDTFVLCLVLGFFVFLTGRFWIPAALFSIVGLLLAFAHGVKIDVRREPVFPSDLVVAGNTGFLKDMVEPSLLRNAGLGVLGIVAVAVLLALLLRKALPRVRRNNDPAVWRILLVARLVCAALCASLVVYAGSFNTPGNYWKRAYEKVGSQWVYWDQERNYRRNGFVGGFLYNLNGPRMTRPDGYSEATMKELAARYTRLAASINAQRNPAALDDVNVVVVLSEALTDPTRIKGVQFHGDPIPNTRRLLQQTYSGNMLAQLIGGGTANMEFEVLTGLSMAQFAPQLTSPFQMLLPHFKEFPGAVRYLKDRGHETLGVHPYSTRMYKRTTAYPVLGMEKFIYNATMQEKHKAPKGRFISDESAFAEIEYQLAQSEAPVVMNMVTMQNHYPWNKQFTEPFPLTGLQGVAQQQIGRYARGLTFTDQAIKDFLDRLRESDEKTAVILYGDHLPGAYPARIQQVNGHRVMHETPFFLWTNFKPLPHKPVPTTSPIYFLPLLFDQLEAPLPPMYALLRQLHQQIPAMSQGRYINAANQEVSEKELSPAAKQMLRDYRLVQFDLAAGEQYVKDELYTLP